MKQILALILLALAACFASAQTVAVKSSAGKVTFRTGAQLRSDMGLAASGANADITSLAPSGGSLAVTGTLAASGAITASTGASGKVRIGSVPADTTYAGVWLGTTAVGSPDFTNYAFLSDGAETILNGPTSFALRIANGNVLQGSTTRLTAQVPLRLKGYTVATLPAGTVGDVAYVTDATAPTYLGTLTGGGSVVAPVFYNGSAWVSH